MDILLEVTFRKIKREREKKSEKESLSEDTQNFSYYNDNIMTSTHKITYHFSVTLPGCHGCHFI